MKKLTKANCSKYGIEVAPEYDFTDDGNRFRGFIYKGMPVTQCFSDDTCYLSIRVDYLHNNFTFKEWMQTEEYRLTDEFNGVSEIDIEKLIDNLDRVIAKVNEMNASAAVSEDEITDCINRISNEVVHIEDAIEEIKSHFQWWNVENSSKMNMITRYMKTLSDKVLLGRTLINTLPTASIRKQKDYVERSSVLGGSFYIDELNKLCKPYML